MLLYCFNLRENENIVNNVFICLQPHAIVSCEVYHMETVFLYAALLLYNVFFFLDLLPINTVNMFYDPKKIHVTGLYLIFTVGLYVF